MNSRTSPKHFKPIQRFASQHLRALISAKRRSELCLRKRSRVRNRTKLLRTTAIAVLLLGGSNQIAAQGEDIIVATVNGQNISQQQVDESIANQLFPLKQQVYALRKAALVNLVVARVLELEAAKRKISVEELRKELMLGNVQVSKKQVEEAYAQNAPLLSLMSGHEARERLRLDLESQQRMKLYRLALEKLKNDFQITILLETPSSGPSLDDGLSPGRGAARPVVTIIEFSDFQCPFCKQVQKTLKEVLETYPNQVRLIFKHLPLDGHRYALKAAAASYCAGEQSRFWEFHDALFTSTDLSEAGLERAADYVGLNQERFRACLNSDQTGAAISRDVEKARLLGIVSTPTFIINGKVVVGAIALAEFRQLIDRQLTTQTQSSTK